MLYSARTKTTVQLIGFTYPKLHTGKNWYVDFYALDPVSGEMRRKKFMLDGLDKKAEKRRRAAEVIEQIMRQLREGWNPWVNTQESRGFTPIQECLDRYLEYIDKKGDRYKTRMRYHSSVNILREFMATLVIQPKYVYQFDQALIIDFLDWLLLDRDAGCPHGTHWVADPSGIVPDLVAPRMKEHDIGFILISGFDSEFLGGAQRA